MAIIPISTLKGKFESGDIPTGADFTDLIDSHMKYLRFHDFHDYQLKLCNVFIVHDYVKNYKTFMIFVILIWNSKISMIF